MSQVARALVEDLRSVGDNQLRAPRRLRGPRDQPRSRPLGMFTVILRRDPEGPCCALLKPDSAPLTRGLGIEYKVVASSDDQGEALGVLALVERAIRSGELR